MRSKRIVLTTALFAASTLAAGCSRNKAEQMRCVDNDGWVVGDEDCEREERRGRMAGFIPMYRWYYGGTPGAALGSRISGGSFEPKPGTEYRSFTTTRGGFGSRSSGAGA